MIEPRDGVDIVNPMRLVDQLRSTLASLMRAADDDADELASLRGWLLETFAQDVRT